MGELGVIVNGYKVSFGGEMKIENQTVKIVVQPSKLTKRKKNTLNCKFKMDKALVCKLHLSKVVYREKQL